VKYHCTIDLLFDWFGSVCLANKNKIVSCHTADFKQFKQEVNGTVILPPLVFPVRACASRKCGCAEFLCLQGCAHRLHRSERERERERYIKKERERLRERERGRERKREIYKERERERLREREREKEREKERETQ
jgi:hypothetical protein